MSEIPSKDPCRLSPPECRASHIFTPQAQVISIIIDADSCAIGETHGVLNY